MARRFRVGEGLELRKAPLVVSLAIVGAYIGVVLIEPGLPGKFAWSDPMIFGLCCYAIASMMYRGSEATSGIARLLPWVWLILLGSFLGLAGVGIPNWAMSNLARTVFALLTFGCLWHLLVVTGLQRLAILGTWIGVGLTVLKLLTQMGLYRAPAFFPHPNYTGHYLAMASMVLFVTSKRWYLKAAAVVALLAGLQLTSSFGAIAMVIAMLGVYGVRLLTRNTAILAAGLAFLAIAGLYMATPQAQDYVADEDVSTWSVTESISVERFERSGDTRLQLWTQALDAYADEPLGIGPDGVRSRKVAIWRGNILEIHSDSLGYLVERGVIGLIGFIGLWVTLIRLGRKGGLARVLIAGMLVQGLFRETMHYRHMWLFLALAFALDYAKSRASDDDGDDAGAATSAVEPGSDTTGAYFPGAPRWPRPA
jgi:hypothetical protein